MEPNQPVNKLRQGASQARICDDLTGLAYLFRLHPYPCSSLLLSLKVFAGGANFRLLKLQISNLQFFHDLAPYDLASSVFIGVHPQLNFLLRLRGAVFIRG
jgi:hypothetical protein